MANRVPQPEGDRTVAYSGRRFSRFSLQHNIYCIPIDQTEQQRLEQLDDVLNQLFQDRTVFPNFSSTRRPDGSRRSSAPTVLDCGCGKGLWIRRFIDEFGEECDVTGVDIHFRRSDDENDDDDDDDDDPDEDQDGDETLEYERKRWNLNARFRDDRSEDQLRPESFDLINSRLLAEGIDASRWQSYIRELKYMLKPGGWLQMVELQLHIQSSNGRLRDDSHLTRWWEWYSSMMQRMGKNPRIGRELGQHLQAEGFTHITARSIDVPIGSWRTGQESLGSDNVAIVANMLTSYSLWPFLRVGNMPQEQYRALIFGARAELNDSSTCKKLYYKVHFAYGQRPRRR